MSVDSDYRAMVLAEGTLLNYWPLGENSSATSYVALAGGVDITPATSTAKPTAGSPGPMGTTSVLFDGSNDHAQSASSIDLSALSKVVLEVAMKRTAFTGGNSIAIEFGTSSAAVNGAFGLNVDGSGTRFAALHKGVAGVSEADHDRPDAGEFVLLHAVFDKTLSTNEVSLWCNGVQLTPTARPFNNNNTDTFGNLVLYLGGRAGTSLFSNVSLAHIALYSDLADARKIAHSIGMGNPDPAASNTTVAITQPILWYNGRTISDTPTQNELCSIKLQTNATQIQVTGTCSGLLPSNSAMARFGVVVNGVTKSQLSFGANGTATLTATLAPYPTNTVRTVELISGPQLLVSGTVQYATFDLTNLTVVGASATLLSPSYTDLVVINGTSIDGGYTTNQQNYDAWPSVARRVYGLNVTVEAWGSRQLYDDIGSSNVLNTTKSQTFANRIAGYNPAVYVSTTGINDWNLIAAWGKVAFCAAYLDFITRLRALRPKMPILIVTPLLYSNEALTNTFLETIGDWRTLITSTFTGMPGVTVLDGTTVVAASYLSDTVHYNSAGELIIAGVYSPVIVTLLNQVRSSLKRQLLTAEAI